MIDAAQIRAARALLDWNRDQLAAACGVSVPALAKIEGEKSTPHGETLHKVQAAFEQAGVVFGDSSGVKRKSEIVTIYEGVDGFKRFSDDRYGVASLDDREFLMCGGLQDDFVKATGSDYFHFHAERMAHIKHFKMRALIQSSSDPEVTAPSYMSQRFLPEAYHTNVPYYVYGSKLAIIAVDETIRIIVINDERTAVSFRKQFNLMWKISTINNPGVNNEK